MRPRRILCAVLITVWKEPDCFDPEGIDQEDARDSVSRLCRMDSLDLRARMRLAPGRLQKYQGHDLGIQ